MICSVRQKKTLPQRSIFYEVNLSFKYFFSKAYGGLTVNPELRVHTPQPKQNSRLFPGFFQALKKIFQAVRVKYEQETSHQSDKLFTK